MNKTLYMETTTIPPEKTAGEIISKLVAAGARQIVMDYGADQKPTGIRFVIERAGQYLPFTLPARTDPVFEYFKKRKKPRYSWQSLTRDQLATLKLQSERVAWRQLLRWVEAQLAMIETGMAQTEEVFLPYLQQGDGQTLYQLFAGQQFKALPAPEGSQCR